MSKNKDAKKASKNAPLNKDAKKPSKNAPLNKAELRLVTRLLGEAADVFSNHTCNDIEIDDTPENRRILEAMENGLDVPDDEKGELEAHGGSLWTFDATLMRHLAKRCGEAAS